MSVTDNTSFSVVKEGDVEQINQGIAALRAWFFSSIKCTQDPDNVTESFPPLPIVEMQDDMATPPPGHLENLPPNAMSIFKFYQKFQDHAFSAEFIETGKEAHAKKARELLKITSDFKTVPHINVGSRFLFHLSHALKTPRAAPGPLCESDPSVPVSFPLFAKYMSHIALPVQVQDATDEHKSLWKDKETGEYDADKLSHEILLHFNWTRALHTAFPNTTLSVLCPLCKMPVSIGHDMAEAVESPEAYIKQMRYVTCRYCGLIFSGLNPNAEVAFQGICPRRVDEINNSD